ncbi:MAG: phosphatase PAP2 family protein [Candidatus Saccharibacteria bacterium]|nr:phosphatase PAP2 family protein [Candidatus Saccharibacteria bacterium]
MELVIKLIADGLVVPVALIGVYVLLRFVPHRQKYQVYARVLMAGLTAYVAAKIAGVLYQPSGLRPFEVLGVEAGASFLNNPGFPSDHALFVVAITLAVAFGARQPKWALVAAVLSLLVCLGRVLALVHTPLDVIGGALIACVGIVWYLPLKREQYNK